MTPTTTIPQDRPRHPAQAVPPRAPSASVAQPEAGMRPMPTFVVRRRRWPGFLAATVLGAAVAAVLVSNWYDDRSLGQRLDASVDAANSRVEQSVQGAKLVATDAAQGAAYAASRVGDALTDANITAAVKTALAADPSLSALAIEVSTDNGVVRLRGPAPDPKALQRAEVLAAAPAGVVRVDNQLVVRAGS